MTYGDNSLSGQAERRLVPTSEGRILLALYVDLKHICDVASIHSSVVIPHLVHTAVVKQGREKDAVTFMELYQRLCSQQVLKSRSSLLHFMVTLASDRTATNSVPSQVKESLQESV